MEQTLISQHIHEHSTATLAGSLAIASSKPLEAWYLVVSGLVWDQVDGAKALKEQASQEGWKHHPLGVSEAFVWAPCSSHGDLRIREPSAVTQLHSVNGEHPASFLDTTEINFS